MNIKSCPNCNSENVLIEWIWTNEKMKSIKWFLSCEDCEHETKAARSMKEAIRIWNKNGK